MAGMGNYRWVICGLLFVATTILYIDRQIIALLKGTLDQQLHWTNAQYGLVSGVFQATYGLGLLGYGWFIDRVGVKVGYAVTIAGWSLAAMGHSLVNSANGFIAARGALGFAESGNFPSAIKAVAQWFPKKERAFATSIFNSGANVGPLLAPAIIPWIAEKWGWRSTFILIGCLGILWQAAWWALFDTPERQRRVGAAELEYIRSDSAEQAGEKVRWSVLLEYRQTWAFVVAKFLTDPVWWFFLFWLPDYFYKSRGLDIKHSWFYIAAIYGIVTVLSNFGGWVTGFLVKQGWSVTRARKTGMIGFAVCVLPICLTTISGNWTAVILIGIAAAAHQAWSANLFTTVSDIFPKKAVASVVGIGGMAGALGGALFPIFAGYLLDRISARTGYTILFGLCSCAYLIAFLLNHLLAPKFETITLK